MNSSASEKPNDTYTTVTSDSVEKGRGEGGGARETMVLR